MASRRRRQAPRIPTPPYPMDNLFSAKALQVFTGFGQGLQRRDPGDADGRRDENVETGGLELLLENSTKVHKVEVPPKDGEGKVTMKGLLSWVKANLIKERPEMFVKGDSVRPGVLVLINDCDWELCGGLDAELEEKDVRPARPTPLHAPASADLVRVFRRFDADGDDHILADEMRESCGCMAAEAEEMVAAARVMEKTPRGLGWEATDEFAYLPIIRRWRSIEE
ncbi:hypothetical protein C2845_PM03G06370 [Panicum miliaceum]|uniref:Ubiquitin-related modifier 1 homolog n=1 Tax=Panicum miliaceum TaxID=4540 RepID=A0A3L6TF78_PANMI|nr:hypothetical protein C2845_PM03G06370 [Panicum miliaceum]